MLGDLGAKQNTKSWPTHLIISLIILSNLLKADTLAWRKEINYPAIISISTSTWSRPLFTFHRLLLLAIINLLLRYVHHSLCHVKTWLLMGRSFWNRKGFITLVIHFAILPTCHHISKDNILLHKHQNFNIFITETKSISFDYKLNKRKFTLIFSYGSLSFIHDCLNIIAFIFHANASIKSWRNVYTKLKL